MKEVHGRLLDLPILHPRLLWETIILAGASVLEGVDRRAPYRFLILAEDIPGFGSEELILTIDPSGYDEESIVRLRRTFELARQVELAAIAVAALAFALSGGGRGQRRKAGAEAESGTRRQKAGRVRY